MKVQRIAILALVSLWCWQMGNVAEAHPVKGLREKHEVQTERHVTKHRHVSYKIEQAKPRKIYVEKKSSANSSRTLVPTEEIKDSLKVVERKTDQPLIRVGLARAEGVVTLAARGDFTVYDGNRKWKSFSAGTKVRLTISGSRILVNGERLGDTVYVKSNKLGIVSYNGTDYRGVMKVIPTVGADGMTVINEVPIEEYLYGVVPKEAPPQWQANALRAQAVAARTYALAHRGGYGAQGFDVVDTITSQVYGGFSAETPQTNEAVNDTAGEIITYQGRPIDAVFCASSGGYTEDSENVWSNYVPYLRAVPEPTNDYTAQEWVVRLTMRELESKLNAAGKGVGKIKKIKLSALKKAPMKSSDRGKSGRVLHMEIQGSQRNLTISGESIQYILELRSRLFDIRGGKRKGEIEVYGYGFGHGVGLSQWGAQIMAQKHPNDAKYYQEILKHFYQGVKIEKAY